MQEMMKEAKLAKEKAAQQKKEDQKGGVYKWDDQEDNESEFYEGVRQKAEQRFREKQANEPHGEEVDYSMDALDQKNAELIEEKAAEFDRQGKIQRNIAVESEKKVTGKSTGGVEIEEIADDANPIAEEENDEEPPDLEELNLEELNQLKEQKQKEWLQNVYKEQEVSMRVQKEAGQPVEEVSDNNSQRSEVNLEDIKLNSAIQNLPDRPTEDNLRDLAKLVSAQAEALTEQPSGTDYDELD